MDRPLRIVRTHVVVGNADRRSKLRQHMDSVDTNAFLSDRDTTYMHVLHIFKGRHARHSTRASHTSIDRHNTIERSARALCLPGTYDRR